MNVTLVEINIKPERVDEFLEVFRANHEGALQEPGNLRFDVLQDQVPVLRKLVRAFNDTFLFVKCRYRYCEPCRYLNFLTLKVKSNVYGSLSLLVFSS